VDQTVRTTLRNAGRLGLLIIAIRVLAAQLYTLAVVIAHGGYLGRNAPTFWLVHVTAWIHLLFVLVVFWAAGSRRRAGMAWTGTGVMTAILVLSYIDLAAGAHFSLIAGRLAFLMVWPVGVALALMISLRGSPLDRDEPGSLRPRSPWMRIVALPLTVLALLGVVAETRLNAPQTALPVLILAAGALYGFMRRRDPARGPAHWINVTLLLAVLALPSSLVGALAAAGASTARQREPESAYLCATAAGILIVLGLAGLRLLGRGVYAQPPNTSLWTGDPGTPRRVVWQRTSDDPQSTRPVQPPAPSDGDGHRDVDA
jgi:hypothetical protein